MSPHTTVHPIDVVVGQVALFTGAAPEISPAISSVSSTEHRP